MDELYWNIKSVNLLKWPKLKTSWKQRHQYKLCVLQLTKFTALRRPESETDANHTFMCWGPSVTADAGRCGRSIKASIRRSSVFAKEGKNMESLSLWWVSACRISTRKLLGNAISSCCYILPMIQTKLYKTFDDWLIGWTCKHPTAPWYRRGSLAWRCLLLLRQTCYHSRQYH